MFATEYLSSVCANVSEDLVQSYEEACEEQTLEEWDLCAFNAQCSLNGEWTQEVLDRGPLDVPATIVCPALAPRLAVQNSCRILHGMLRQSQLVVLPESKMIWALEGEGVWTDVALFLDGLLARLTFGAETRDESAGFSSV